MLVVFILFLFCTIIIIIISFLTDACMFMCLIKQEEQVQKVRVQNTAKLQQLDTAIQEKLGQAQTRKEQLEQEQKEKLRNYVSLFIVFFVGKAVGASD